MRKSKEDKRDACGHYIGGGYLRCPRCKIYLCLVCSLDLQKMTQKVSIEVPDVRGEFM